MDISLASKLLKYNPADVQTATYVVEYAKHNYAGDAVFAYIDQQLAESPTQQEIAGVILEGYKPIDRKKENAMYRRAGNLARTSLSSKGKAKEDAQNKSAKIVSAISTQKEKERFERIGKDPKHQNNYKEELEIEEGLEKARENVGAGKCWDGYVAKGTKMKDGKEVPNCVPANEEWIWDLVDELAEDFELLTDEDLEDVIIEALVDLEDEELLQEAVESFEGLEMLNEDYYASAVKASKDSAKRIAREKRVERVKKAASRVGSALKSGAKKAGDAVKSGASKAGETAKKAGSAAKSAVKSGAKSAIGAGAKAAGHAVGSYQAARIKAKREALSKSKSSKPAEKKPEGKDNTGGKLDSLLKSVRGGSSSSSSSSGGGSSSSSGGSSSSSTTSSGSSSSSTSSSEGGTKKKSLLRRAAGAVGRGIKKAVGKTARAVSKGSDKLARKLGEQNSMESQSRTQRIRQILAMQETVEHDKHHAKNPEGVSWRDRLGMVEEKTPEQKAKSAALAKSKELTKQGKHKEASEVFRKAFPNFGK